MKEIPENWRALPIVDVIKASGVLPCGSCGEAVYGVREGVVFEENHTRDARDFYALGNYPDPENGTVMTCPKCGGEMVSVGKM